MSDFRSEIPRECGFPGCDADAEHIETSLLMTMCTQHMELLTAKLPAFLELSLQWRNLSEPLDDLDIRDARVNIERTILTLSSLKIRN